MDRPYIGLMSGTSCDGVDGVIAVFSSSQQVKIVSAAHQAFEPDFKIQLKALQGLAFDRDPFTEAALVTQQLVDRYAAIVKKLCDQASLSASEIAAIGCHGQTIRHRPELGFTLQLNDPARLVEQTGILTIADFRSRDIAAGGQGAPLTPAFHRWLFDHPSKKRVIINLGGITNITDISTGMGFDSGPANTLLDAWILRHQKRAYDNKGDWARSGRCLTDVLNAMLKESYFSLRPPKSTGQDLFNLDWVAQYIKGDERPEDIQRTLLELTAMTIVNGIYQLDQLPDEILLCGGGIYNHLLIETLKERLNLPIYTTEVAGLHPMHVEAAAFAWLARQTLHQLPGNLPSATGAEGLRVLGSIYPV